jgi:hypothetical protein
MNARASFGRGTQDEPRCCERPARIGAEPKGWASAAASGSRVPRFFMNPECEFTFVIALRRAYYGAVEIGKRLDIAGHYVCPREREVPPAKHTTFVIVATEEHQSTPAGRSLSAVLALIQQVLRPRQTCLGCVEFAPAEYRVEGFIHGARLHGE